MENKVCDGCKVVKDLEELDAVLKIRKNLLKEWQYHLVDREDAVEKRARMNRRVMLFNIATSVVLLGLCLVKLFG